MPKADRIAQLGDGVRCNKTVAKVDLPKLRTSSQVNYPESAARPHILPTFGGVALPAIRRANAWDVTPGEDRRRQLQLAPEQILSGIVESFDGTHSGLYSDWQRTSPNARKSLNAMRQERMKSRSPSKRRGGRSSPTKQRQKRGGVHDTHENRHDRDHTRREDETRQFVEGNTKRKNERVLLSATSHSVIKKSVLTKLQEESGFGIQELRNVMASFHAHADHDPVTRSVSREAFSDVMAELFDGITEQMREELFVAMDEDGSGTIDYGELVKGCAKLVHDLSSEDRFKLIFDAYDHDGSGTIESNEVSTQAIILGSIKRRNVF